ncbi:unnamed protein product [Bursaphelenchus xylophilus]|uniref:(pine wood nematode) hypothetical protein n=1 Tax=Bursaphelenchus xylophilus TaxID=6326 RepID=A0A1I7RUW6_BURXY|nr:unnamed protein product [Bursaphelenchus xylophilus]CAG9105359.1 unnamed protein product [Bursaphelenchus xylophilus]
MYDTCVKKDNWCFNVTGMTVYSTHNIIHGCAPNYIKQYCDKYRPFSNTDTSTFCIRFEEVDLNGRLCCCNDVDFCNANI